jgi:hypothetical protein
LKKELNTIVYEFSIPFSELEITSKKILKFIRSDNSSLDEYSNIFLEDFLIECENRAEVRGGFVVISDKNFRVTGDRFYIDKVEFLSQKIITSRLRKASSVVLFAATAGNYFEEYSKKLILGGDLFSGFLVDSAASEVAEAAAEWIQNKIELYASDLSHKITSRYSPGYCGWNVGEQHKLFSFFPDNFCGIRLTESALMIPIKSVSGIIGTGKEVKKEDYQCEICDDQNCFRRNII